MEYLPRDLHYNNSVSHQGSRRQDCNLFNCQLIVELTTEEGTKYG